MQDIASMLSAQQWAIAFTGYSFAAALLAPCTFWAFMITAGKVPAYIQDVRKEEYRHRKARSEKIDRWIRDARYPSLVLTLVSLALAVATAQLAAGATG